MNIRLIILKHLLLAAAAFFAAYAVTAATGENFNSRKGVPIHKIKTKLQNSCWTFHQFDVNQDGWNPRLEGDGAMVATAGAGLARNSGIYTPVLLVENTIEVSFDYTFSENFLAGERRWLDLCLLNASNEPIRTLDHIEFPGAGATIAKKYNTSFDNIPAGEYRLALRYGSSGGGTARIAVDQLYVSAQLKYPSGCNMAPVALRDRIKGMADRTAAGNLLENDGDRNGDQLTAYLVKSSPDGLVDLKTDGTFVFTPHTGFDGNVTSFIYKVCDNGAGNLCTENKTVYINFPAESIVHGLVDFHGSYKFNGYVELNWKTKSSAEIRKFEIERSLDGKSWETTGMMHANPETNSNTYAYKDRLTRNVVHRKDIYYRLRQVAADGNESISRLLVVRVYNTRTLTMISVTPNPTKNDIAVNLQLQETSWISVRVLNGSGVPIIHKSIEVEKGTHNIIIDGTSGLQAGLYMLEVIVNSRERMLVKLVKEQS